LFGPTANAISGRAKAIATRAFSSLDFEDHGGRLWALQGDVRAVAFHFQMPRM
jgi:hypothetical protein